MEKCLEFRAQGSMRPRLSSRNLRSKSVDFSCFGRFSGCWLEPLGISRVPGLYPYCRTPRGFHNIALIWAHVAP